MKFYEILRGEHLPYKDLPDSIKNLKVETVLVACAKCASSGDIYEQEIHRHHLGCERMWLEHFKSRNRTKLYKAYKARYESFNEADIVRLCATHHKLIHVIYLQQINRMVEEGGYRKLSEWSWEEARGMMKVLRKVGRLWIEGRL